MKSDRPLIGSILSLASGLGLILGYGQGNTSFNAAYPFTGTVLHIDIMTVGLGVLGGLALIAIGLLLLVWAFLAAIVGLIIDHSESDKSTERLLG